MSNIEISGYGFRRRICEDAACWFLNRFLPRYNLNVAIIHRGLKREHAYGWCDFDDDHRRPRSFVIELQSHLPEKLYIQTLFHELVHCRQLVLGTLRQKYGKLYYGPHKVEDYDYWDQPHEIEAREQEIILYHQYQNDRKKSELIQFFPNRLLHS